MDRLEHDAVRAAASFIREHRESFSVRVPASPMGIAVFAIKAYAIFLDADIEMRAARDVARAMIDAVQMFDRGTPA
jgi:hypothetical protein